MYQIFKIFTIVVLSISCCNAISNQKSLMHNRYTINSNLKEGDDIINNLSKININSKLKTKTHLNENKNQHKSPKVRLYPKLNSSNNRKKICSSPSFNKEINSNLANNKYREIKDSNDSQIIDIVQKTNNSNLLEHGSNCKKKCKTILAVSCICLIILGAIGSLIYFSIVNPSQNETVSPTGQIFNYTNFTST